MKIVVTGSDGMLGKTLCPILEEQGHKVFAATLKDFDITNLQATRDYINDADPDWVIHPAAMTAVDDCESQSDLAYKINAVGSMNMAVASYENGAAIIGVSTDYVFGGGIGRPHNEYDAPNPQTVYGASKLAGEEAIRRHNPLHTIIRIAWLYGKGGPSFLHTMVRLGKQRQQTGEALRIVDDQKGTPTSTRAVSKGIVQIIEQALIGTYHLTCEGEATWYEFTKEIFRLANIDCKVEPCSTEEFPRPASRPGDSRLDNYNWRLQGMKPLPQWQTELADFLSEELEYI